MHLINAFKNLCIFNGTLQYLSIYFFPKSFCKFLSLWLQDKCSVRKRLKNIHFLNYLLTEKGKTRFISHKKVSLEVEWVEEDDSHC